MSTVQAKQRRRWVPELLTGLAVASGIGYLATAYAISRRLTRASPARPKTNPADYGLPWEPLLSRTADGHHLVGWAVSPPNPRATVVLFHGLRHNREHTLGRIAFLAAAGYRCVAFDHRAHGESSGRKTSFGYYESRDVSAAVNLVHTRWPNQPRAALGISMGAAALCFAASPRQDWQAVILESLYHDIAAAFKNRIGNHYPRWFKRLSHGVIWVTERRLGLRLRQLAPAEHIGQFDTTPVMLITGNEDTHASPADTKRLYERCQGPREIWVVPRASHADVFETGGPCYQRRILDFLARLNTCA